MTLSKTLARCASGLAAAVLLLAGSAAVAAEWAHKKKFSFDLSPTGVELKEEVAQLPVLMRLHSGNLTFSQLKADGADLRFFAADGKTPLKAQIENFDAANALANVWVSIPRLGPNSAKNEAVVMAWGNDKAQAEPDAGGLYDSTQIFVYHFASSGSDAAELRDATGNGLHARGVGVKPQPAGTIGPALSLDGRARVEVPAGPALKLSPSTGFTFTAWVKPAANAAGTLFALGDKGLQIALGAGRVNVGSASSGVLRPDAWQHVAVVGATGKVRIYLDGIESGQGALSMGEWAGPAVIGEGLTGEIDEVTLASLPRSAAYLSALVQSQIPDAPLLVPVEDEGGGDGVSYFSILIASVTLDGWIVIGLLAVMAAISTYVMVSKTLLLRRANRANDVFLAVFEEKSAELLTPGSSEIQAVQVDPRTKQSSIYRLYEIGLKEMLKRFEHQSSRGLPLKLSGAGLEAIRASLDARMLRENQRFNSGMVLLTIAISGGPFLGLLGTVVGVMITFAAIAAAGEVNVNSIAPGIAAALVATVAGLGVAIPALFGYNWLAAQIKNITGDTQVFVDEFVTKTAEMHAD